MKLSLWQSSSEGRSHIRCSSKVGGSQYGLPMSAFSQLVVKHSRKQLQPSGLLLLVSKDLEQIYKETIIKHVEVSGKCDETQQETG